MIFGVASAVLSAMEIAIHDDASYNKLYRPYYIMIFITIGLIIFVSFLVFLCLNVKRYYKPNKDEFNFKA